MELMMLLINTLKLAIWPGAINGGEGKYALNVEVKTKDASSGNQIPLSNTGCAVSPLDAFN